MKWIKKVASTPLSAIAKVIDSLSEQANDRYNAPSIRAVREMINNDYTELAGICTGLANTIGTKTPLDMVGDAYSDESAYAVGEYCIYNNTLYKCNTPITVGEDFDPEKWDETNIADEIKAAEDAADDKIGDLSDLETTDKTNIVAAINEVLTEETPETVVVQATTNEYYFDLLGRLWQLIDFSKLTENSYITSRNYVTPSGAHGGKFRISTYNTDTNTAKFVSMTGGQEAPFMSGTVIELIDAAGRSKIYGVQPTTMLDWSTSKTSTAEYTLHY